MRFAGLTVIASSCAAREANSAEAAGIRVERSELRQRTLNVPVASPLQRRDKPQLELELRLRDVPRGVAIPLSCEWRAPNGEARYHNHWHTKTITHDPWPTHCRQTFDTHDSTGTWQVVMLQSGRELGSEQFVLE
jgi:hypothetical protein